jgi:hypothetical protein
MDAPNNKRKLIKTRGSKNADGFDDFFFMGFSYCPIFGRAKEMLKRGDGRPSPGPRRFVKDPDTAKPAG